MDKKFAIVGHIDHSKTTLASAIVKVLSEQENKIHVLSDEIEQERGISIDTVKSFPITNPYIYEPVFYDNINHRTRKRKQERQKQKLKNKYKGNRNLFKK
jgi:hypothetical protein